MSYFTKPRLLTFCAAVFVCSIQAHAQSMGDAGLSIVLARNHVGGGVLDSRTGALVHVLAATPVKTNPRWSMVATGGLGAIVGSTGGRCLINEDGSCAPKGNFAVLDAMLGFARPIASFKARMLAGPALYNGADDTSIGLQGQLDINAPLSQHLGIGVVIRAALLPSHGGERLAQWAAGGSVSFR